MKVRKSLLIATLFIAILTFPLIQVNPSTLAKGSVESLPIDLQTEGTSQLSSTGTKSKVTSEPPNNELLEMLKSYVPKEKIDPGIEHEIAKGVGDVRVIVFYDILLKGEMFSSLPQSVKIGSDFESVLPFLSLRVPSDINIVQDIAEISGVKAVYLDRTMYPYWITKEQMAGAGIPSFESPYEGKPPFLLNETTELIGAQDLWDLSFTGDKVVIAVTDTGINKEHPNFYFANGKNKVIFEYVAVDEDFNGFPDFGPEDIIGHGTHVASTAAGTGRTGGADFFYDATNGSYSTIYLEPGTQKGVAPDAYLMNIKISHDGWAYTSWMLEGYVQAVLHGADVISTSFGGHYEFPEWDFPFIYTVEWATQNGVVVVMSAGNEGPDFGSIGSPGYSDSVITVGATTKLDRVAWWSSRGPSTPLAIFGSSFLPFEATLFPSRVNATASGALKTKPDVVAPGESISAAYAHFTQTEPWYVQEGAPAEGVMYITFSGTSMAAPHVAGAAALLLEAFPGAKPSAVKAGMLKGAKDLGLDPNVQGSGRLDIAEAYNRMNQASKVSSSIAAPLEDIPATAPEFGPYPYFTGTDVLVEDRISNYESFSNYLTTLEADNASLYYTSGELYNPSATIGYQWNGTQINTPHPYTNNYDRTWLFESPGAGWLHLYFPKIRLADAGDIIIIRDKYGGIWWVATGPAVLYNQWIWVQWDQASVQFQTNAAGTEWGFEISGFEIYDVPAGRRFIYSTSLSDPSYPDPRPQTATTIESPHPYVDTTVSTSIASPSPYPDNYYNEWTITQPGAAAMNIHFSLIDLEPGRDYVRVFDKSYRQWNSFTGYYGAGTWSNWIVGDTVIIRMTSDETVTLSGFTIDQYRYYSFYETTFTLQDGARTRLHFDTINIEPGDQIRLSDTEGTVHTITWAPNERHANNILINAAYDVGEWIYRDADNNWAVSPGDVRLTGVLFYVAGSTVIIGDMDIGITLIAFNANERHRENVVTNGAFDVGEFIYRDLDNTRTVTVGDVRLTDVPPFLAGSIVALGNADIGNTLATFALMDYWTPEFRGDGCKLKISITLSPNTDGFNGWGFRIDRYEHVKYDSVFYEEGAALIMLHFENIRLEPGDILEIKANDTTPILYWWSASGFDIDNFWLPLPQLGAGAGWNTAATRTGGSLKIAIITDNDGVTDGGYVIDRYAVWYDYPSAHMLSNYDAFLMLEPTSGGPTLKVTNGGFETGASTGWEFEGDGDHKVVNTQPGSGTYSALLGFKDSPSVANGLDWMYQTVKVPAGAQRVLLSFQFRVHTWDSWVPGNYYDRFTAWVRDEEGNNLDEVGTWGGTVWPVYQDLMWDHIVYDLSLYAGQTIQIYFEVFNRVDVLYPTWVYVDDVSVSGQYITNSALKDYVTAYGGDLLITGDWAEMIPKPDDTDPYLGYNYYTKDLGITWSDTVGGGYTTRITSHNITRNVSTVYFGGPVASLVPGTGVTTVVYDPYLPGVCYRQQTGKIVAISDDDVLNDLYLNNPMYESDNLRLGLNIIAWFAGIDSAIFDQKLTENLHDIGLGVTYPVFIVNGTSTTVELNVHNFGNYTETTIHAWLQVYNSEWEMTYNKTMSATPAGGFTPGETETINFAVPAANMSTDLYADNVYIWGMASLWANLTDSGDNWAANNWWPWWTETPINLIVKTPRTGVNPILNSIEPKSLNSYTSPFVAVFPGDWKPVNVTFLTSGKLVNGAMSLTGNITNIADFYSYNSTSELFEPIGDSIDITLKDMSWWQHTTTDTITRSPSSQSGSWTNPTGAYSSNNNYAYSDLPNAQHIYRNYGLYLPPDAVVTKVEVGIEAFTWWDERIGIYVSWTGGATWSLEQISDTLPWYDYNNQTWFDFTNVTHWTPSKLSNADFRVRIEHEVVGDPSRTWIDWLPVRVTYTSSVMLSLYDYGWSSLCQYPPHIVPALDSTGHAFGYMEIKIPDDASPGTYTGSVTVYNGTTSLESMPINIQVKAPKAKILYEDMGHYMLLLTTLYYIYYEGSWPWDVMFDYKFLWNAYFDAWVKAAQWGYDIDSLLLTQNFMKLDLEETFKEELPWRWEEIVAAKFEETYSSYSTILEFNNKYPIPELWVYYKVLDSGLYGPGYLYYSVLDVYDLILRQKGNLVMLADEWTQDSLADWGGYNDILGWLTGGDIQVSYNRMFNWTVTRDHMQDFPHWITRNVENFTMAGWCYPGYGGLLDYGGYFLSMPETGTTAALTNIESPHPYPSDYTNEWSITVPGAEYISVHFATIDLEGDDWDRKGDWIKLYDNNHTLVDWYTGAWWSDQWSSWIPGNTTYIKMSTDQDLQSWGFKIDMYMYGSKDGVQVLSMGTQKIEYFDDWEVRMKEGWQWGPVMAIDEHLTGQSFTTGLPFIGSKVFVLGEANQFENLFLEYQDMLTSDISSLTAGYGKPMTWTIDTLWNNILTYMSDTATPTTTLAYSTPNYTIAGDLYVKDTTAFSLTAQDTLIGVNKTYYKIDEEDWQTYTLAFNLAALEDGEHTITYHSIDMAENTEPEKSLTVVLDTTPPTSTMTYEGSTMIIEDTVYIKNQTTLSISTEDELAGIDEVSYRINGGAWTTYTTPFTLETYTDGEYTIAYRSIDLVANEETEKTITVTLDRTSPTTTVNYSGPHHESGGSTYIKNTTLISLSVEDAFAGVDDTYCKIEDGEWTMYSDAFKLTHRADGDYTLYYYSSDFVENVEPRKTQVLTLDNTPPNLQIESIGVTPGLTTSDMNVTWSVSDDASGIDYVEVKIDDKDFIRVENSSYTFTGVGDGSHTVYVRAVDNLGNTGAVDETGAVVREISDLATLQSYWPYVAGGVIIIAIIIAAAAYIFMRRKKTPS